MSDDTSNSEARAGLPGTASAPTRGVPYGERGAGVCVLARGEVVAWFATFDDAAEDWCTENYFGEWAVWRAAAPTPIPLTDEEVAESKRKAAELHAKFTN